MSGKVISHPGIERCTAKRKAELGLEIIKEHKRIMHGTREYGLKRSEIENWIDTFMEHGR